MSHRVGAEVSSPRPHRPLHPLPRTASALTQRPALKFASFTLILELLAVGFFFYNIHRLSSNTDRGEIYALSSECPIFPKLVVSIFSKFKFFRFTFRLNLLFPAQFFKDWFFLRLVFFKKLVSDGFLRDRRSIAPVGIDATCVGLDHLEINWSVSQLKTIFQDCQAPPPIQTDFSLTRTS